MKHLDKLIPMAMGLAMLTSCADNDMPFFAVTDPGTNAEYAYLNEYDVLKNYINPNANPNFKLGLGVDAGSFDAGNAQYQIAATNFNEVTPGNEMKYASIVGDDGSMNFSTVANMIEDAKAAGLTIYGHTLAWHSQQNVKYLNSLIADKVVDSGPAESAEIEDAMIDYGTLGSYNWWNGGADYGVEIEINSDGNLLIHSKKTDPTYAAQYHVADGINWVAGRDYTFTMMARASEYAGVTFCAGTWGGNKNTTVGITSEWQEIEVTLRPDVDGSGFIMFQSGTFEGDIEVQWIRVTHTETQESMKNVYLYQNDFSGTEHPGGWGNSSTFEIVQGAGPDGSAAMKITNPSAVNPWEAQFAVDFTTPFTVGEKYYVSYKIKGSGSGNLGNGLQRTSDYASAGDFGNAPFNTEWKEVTLSCTCTTEDATRLVFSFGDFAGDIYIDDLEFYIQKPANMEPLTPEEKKDTLTWAMDQWITGIMNATGGYVTTWDAVNEAISGGDTDGDGWYDLQSAETGDPSTNFYWQDYLTPEDYVPIVTKLATQRFEEAGGDPSQLKLFINDYNLESTWDNNKKLESLIHWISVWEAKGAKIDGIGTQMHVSYILNPTQQKTQEDAIVRMFQLMAATGKLVKISELDMGIVENQFEDAKKSEDVTYEEKLKMADFYKFIIEKYFEIIPQSQQYGITQWCCTYSPADSGWRAGEPCGLWDSNYNRTPMYGGFANGLAGQVIVEPSPVPGDGSDAGAVEETPAN